MAGESARSVSSNPPFCTWFPHFPHSSKYYSSSRGSFPTLRRLPSTSAKIPAVSALSVTISISVYIANPRGTHLHGLLQSPVVLSLLDEALVLLRDGAQCMRHRAQLGVSLVQPFFEFDELGSNGIRALQDSVHRFVATRLHLQQMVQNHALRILCIISNITAGTFTCDVMSDWIPSSVTAGIRYSISSTVARSAASSWAFRSLYWEVTAVESVENWR